MFSLIIVIISIALVVALIAATGYHGGETLTQGRAHASAVGLVNVAGQVTAALYLRDAQGDSLPANSTIPVSGLGGHIRAIPPEWEIACGESVCRVVKLLQADQGNVCLTVNELAGLGRTFDLAVYDLVHARYHCIERLDAQGAITGYQFNYLYRR